MAQIISAQSQRDKPIARAACALPCRVRNFCLNTMKIAKAAAIAELIFIIHNIYYPIGIKVSALICSKENDRI